jgi:uncharacterized protein (TIGR00369 family)
MTHPATHQRIAQSFQAQGLMKTLGATLEHVVDSEVQIGLMFSAALSQQHGYVHAGAITSVLDTACGYAALTRAPEGFEVVTAEFKINLLRPAIGERFVATGRVLQAGRTLAVCTGEVRAFGGSEVQGQSEGKVVAVMQATMAFVSR